MSELINKYLDGIKDSNGKIDKKKVFIEIGPYLIAAYIANKFSYAYRLTVPDNFWIRVINALNLFGESFKNPLPSIFLVDVLIGIAVGLIFKLVVIYKKSTKKNYMPDIENGSAKWSEHKDIIPFMSKDPFDNIILTKTEGLMLNDKPKNFLYDRNKHVCVVGSSGSGKSYSVVEPNLLQMHSSYVVTDPKGVILVNVGKVLQKGPLVKNAKGEMVREPYDIKIFNTINFKKSLHYNPFAYLKTEKDIMEFLNMLMANTQKEGASSGDPFWEEAEKLLLSALVSYLIFEAPIEEQNFAMIMEMLNAFEVREEDESFKNAIDYLFEDLEEENPTHYAVLQYKLFKLAAGKTAKSILISIAARLAPFNINEVKEITSYDELELDTLGDRRTALFVIISDMDKTFNFLVAIMYSQLFKGLCEKADEEYGGELPYKVRFILDEFANIGKIPDFKEKMATIRSRGLSVTMILQAKAQIKDIYKEAGENILNNCDSYLFLGGSDNTTIKEMVEKLGKQTVYMNNVSTTKGSSESSSVSVQKIARDLMASNEISILPRNKCLLLINGVDPFKSDKYDLSNHPYYKWTARANKSYAFDLEKYAQNYGKAKLKANTKINVCEIVS